MIEVTHVTKNYGPFKAVRDISFTVEKEQVVGFLGPNGAGKTSVMKILTGYHYPSSGEARIDGVSVEENPVFCKQRIGYLPENVPLYAELTVDEYLNFIAQSRHLSRAGRTLKIAETAALCGLENKRGARIETLSKGYKQRVGLAQAILHDPPILILDEPTTGLDPNQIIEIRSLIKDLGKRKTVILSTHILQEVEAVCDQVLILNEGKIAAQGAPDSIARTMRGGETWNLLVKGENAQTVRAKLEQLAAGKALSIVNISVEDEGAGQSAGFFIESRADSAENVCDNGEILFDWAVANGIKILSMQKKKLSLEDIFVRLTNENSTQEAAA